MLSITLPPPQKKRVFLQELQILEIEDDHLNLWHYKRIYLDNWRNLPALPLTQSVFLNFKQAPK